MYCHHPTVGFRSSLVHHPPALGPLTSFTQLCDQAAVCVHPVLTLQPDDVPLDYSLRAYLARLYLDPAVQISVCEHKVNPVNMISALTLMQKYTVSNPQVLGEPTTTRQCSILYYPAV